MRPSYSILKEIGHGSYSRVFKVSVPQHGLLAMKRVDKHKLGPIQTRFIETESLIAKKVEHPHVVKIYDSFQDENYFYILMTYGEGGDFLAYMWEHKIIPEERAKKFFRQLVLAVDYTHGLGYIHRDIKFENILLDKEQEHIWLGDWGFAGTWKKGQLHTDMVGSLQYAAPEVCTGVQYTGPEIDCWTLGIVLYGMVVGKLPFAGGDNNPSRTRTKIILGNYTIPKSVSSACAELIQSLLTGSSSRYNTQDILKHRWLRTDLSVYKMVENKERCKGRRISV